jgi:hypothetical protein
MCWTKQQLARWAGFSDLAEIQHDGRLAELADHGEVVRDKQVRELMLISQSLDQRQDAGLGRHVKSACRLIENERLGPDRQSTSDGNSLPLPTRQLVREPVRESGLQRDLLEEFLNATRYLAPGDNPVGREDLRDRGADLHSRIKAVVGVLEDDLDIPPVRLQTPAAETQHVMPLKDNFAGDGRAKPHNRSTDCGFA